MQNTLKKLFSFSQVKYFVQQATDARINSNYPNLKQTKIPNLGNLGSEQQGNKVTLQGEQTTSKENLRIKVELRSCKEINGMIAYI